MARAKTPGNGNTRMRQVATMPVVNPTDPKKSSPSTDLEVEIRRRAYELYESRGYGDGQAIEDWIQAEREVRARQSQKHSA